MTIQNAIVQTSYTIFDDNDNQLVPGEICSVDTDGPLVESYILNGFLTIVPSEQPAQAEAPKAEAPKAEEKKAVANQKTRVQETEATNSQENANG